MNIQPYVIPVYKSGAWIDELVSRIGAVMEREALGRFELILVNDCSPDTVTWPAIKRNAEKHPWVRGFDLLYNVGQFRAIMCGLHQARGPFVLTMDDDLQHIPEEIPKLILAMQEDEDILCVIGQFETKQHNVFRNMGSLLYQKIINRVYGNPTNVKTTGFRIIRKELVEAILSCRTAKPQISPLLFSMTRKIKNIPVQHAPRAQGRSGYSVSLLVSTTFENIINASISTEIIQCNRASFCRGQPAVNILYFLRWLTGGIGVAGFTTNTARYLFWWTDAGRYWSSG